MNEWRYRRFLASGRFKLQLCHRDIRADFAFTTRDLSPEYQHTLSSNSACKELLQGIFDSIAFPFDGRQGILYPRQAFTVIGFVYYPRVVLLQSIVLDIPAVIFDLCEAESRR